MIVAFSVAIALLGGALAVIIGLRHFAYRRRIRFDPRQDWVLGLCGSAITTIPADSDDNVVFLPKEASECTSALLEIRVRSSFLGWLLDPSIEITGADFNDVQYFERGAVGSRFINITRFLRNAEWDKGVRLSGRLLKVFLESAQVHLCAVGINDKDRVLVVAPHPDDAEISAFGVYSSYHSTILTMTAGDLSDRYHQKQLRLSPSTVAKLRVWDSLTIPRLGGVPEDRIINLCLPDGSLQQLSNRPDAESVPYRKADCSQPHAVDFEALRAMNRSPLAKGGTLSTWSALVDAIAEIIRASRPTIIVTPHPKMDPHIDHQYATCAVCEAMQRLGSKSEVRNFLFSFVHNRRSELWPFGPTGAGVNLPPMFASDGICGSGFYSHSMSPAKQEQKFLALEAMHDLREIVWPIPLTLRSLCSRTFREVKALIQGMDLDPTSYFRRAVRPDELFITASVKDAIALVEDVRPAHRVSAAAAAKPK